MRQIRKAGVITRPAGRKCNHSETLQHGTFLAFVCSRPLYYIITPGRATSRPITSLRLRHSLEPAWNPVNYFELLSLTAVRVHGKPLEICCMIIKMTSTSADTQFSWKNRPDPVINPRFGRINSTASCFCWCSRRMRSIQCGATFCECGAALLLFAIMRALIVLIFHQWINKGLYR